MTIHAMLARLEDLYTRRDLAASDKQAALEAMLTPEQRAELLQHDAAYEELAERIAAAEQAVKAAVAEIGETVKGARYQAVWNKPRVSWDTQGLVQYFKAHDLDALERYRKQGAPSVSIRQVAQ